MMISSDNLNMDSITAYVTMFCMTNSLDLYYEIFIFDNLFSVVIPGIFILVIQEILCITMYGFIDLFLENLLLTRSKKPSA